MTYLKGELARATAQALNLFDVNQWVLQGIAPNRRRMVPL